MKAGKVLFDKMLEKGAEKVIEVAFDAAAPIVVDGANKVVEAARTFEPPNTVDVAMSLGVDNGHVGFPSVNLVPFGHDKFENLADWNEWMLKSSFEYNPNIKTLSSGKLKEVFVWQGLFNTTTTLEDASWVAKTLKLPIWNKPGSSSFSPAANTSFEDIQKDLIDYLIKCFQENWWPVIIYGGHGIAASKNSTNTFAFEPFADGRHWRFQDFAKFLENVCVQNRKTPDITLVMLSCWSMGAQFQADGVNYSSPINIYVKYSGREVGINEFVEVNGDVKILTRPKELQAYVGKTAKDCVGWLQDNKSLLTTPRSENFGQIRNDLSKEPLRAEGINFDELYTPDSQIDMSKEPLDAKGNNFEGPISQKTAFRATLLNTPNKTNGNATTLKLRVAEDANPSHLLKVALLLAANGRAVDVQPQEPDETVYGVLKRGLILEDQKNQLLLFETTAILRYLSSLPENGDAVDRGIVNQWLELDEQAEPPLLDYVKNVINVLPYRFDTTKSKLPEIICWTFVHTQLLRDPSFRETLNKPDSRVLEWHQSLSNHPFFSQGLKLFEQTFLPLIKITPFKPKPVVRPPTTKLRSEDIIVDVTLDDKTVLPVAGERNILITSALPYVNNVPHLGNIIGCVLSADVYARYCRLRGYNTLYICGTDEYGTATETKALQEKVTPQEICDKYHVIHRDIYKWFDISFDFFGRTTTPHQTTIAQDIFLKLHANNLLLENSLEQLYCENDQRFLADRYVEGTCPICKYQDARGDQCDKCQQLLEPERLENPRCKICGTRPVIKSSTHMFLDLPVLQPRCAQFVEKSSEEGKWSSNGTAITKKWLNEGLKPRCITRDLKWGTPVPLEAMKEKVFYVWFDAPIGYLSITANYTSEWEKWWKNPEQVKLYQFMGKDNVPFHTVIFPSSLIGTNENYTLLHHVSTTEYLNYEDAKFSKSLGIGVFGNNVMDSGVPVSVWRYYLLANRPETNDSQFTWSDFANKVNGELVANLGNFVNRSLKFLKSKFGGTIPEYQFTPVENELVEKLNGLLQEYVQSLEAVELRNGLRIVMEISAIGNKYLADNGLNDALLKSDPVRCGTLIAVAVNIVYCLASLIHPYLPSSSDQILAQLHAPLHRITTEFTVDLLPGHTIADPGHLFSRIEDKDAERFRKMYGGQQATAVAKEPKVSKAKAKAPAAAPAPLSPQWWNQQEEQNREVGNPILPAANLRNVFLFQGQLNANGDIVQEARTLATDMAWHISPTSLDVQPQTTLQQVYDALSNYYTECLKENSTPVVVYGGHGAAATERSTTTFAFAPFHNDDVLRLLDFMRFSERLLCADNKRRALILVLLCCFGMGAQLHADLRNSQTTLLKVYVKYSGREVGVNSGIAGPQEAQYFIYEPADLHAYTGKVSQKFKQHFTIKPGDLLSYTRVNIDDLDDLVV